MMNTRSSARIYLIPAPITEAAGTLCIPQAVQDVVKNLRLFIVEEEKTARRFLKNLQADFPLPETKFFVYNEHSDGHEAGRIMDQVGSSDCGLLSEAGAPCVADPGAEIVRVAQDKGFEVVPLVGPSSILLALMASGLNGQQFCFHGYLPKDKEARKRKLKELEVRSQREHETQIFMEAPYRNETLLESILEACDGSTQLCIACDLTGAEQFVKTKTVGFWRQEKPLINKRPTIFLLGKR